MAPPEAPLDPARLEALASQDFLRAAVARDQQAGRYGGQVVTRFPPEPNGYLHIGHAKAIVVDFGIARDFGGRCHLRMDDTNPANESIEFARSIEKDVRWLGFDWGVHLYFAADMYEDMYRLAERLVQKGLAYVDEQSLDQIREGRGSLTEAGRESPWRDRPVAESLALFRRMRAGDFPDGSLVLRAKIDMAAANMLLRDPILYRIKHTDHYRTGDAWCIYPMYDFAHCLEDALEGVTHSFCTLEFQDNRALYDWFIEKTEVVPPERAPRQYEMARLEVEYILTSKRRLKQLVEEGFVRGWDDPRMPTLAGLRRRGVPPEALVAFCERVGIAKTNSRVELALLEHSIRDHLNTRAPRRMGVLDPLPLVVDNWGEDEVEWIDAPDWPEDVGLPGSRKVPFTRELLIERDDFMVEPSPGFKRLSPGGVVRLRHGYVIECVGVDRDGQGAVSRVHVRAFRDLARGSAPAGVKVPGTIHWVSASLGRPAELRLYDRMFTVPSPANDSSGKDFVELIHPESLLVHQGMVEPALWEELATAPGLRFQLERIGFFCADPDTRLDAPDGLVLNRTVALKDSWARKQDAAAEAAAAEDPAETGNRGEDPDKRRRKKRPASELRAEARLADPALQAGLDALRAGGIAPDDADVLTGDAATLAFFQACAAACGDPAAAATSIVHDLRGAMAGEDLAALPFDGATLGRLLRLQADGTLTAHSTRAVLDELLARGGEPAEIVERLGLRAIGDRAAVEAMVDGVLAAHPDEVGRFRGGEEKLQGFFMGLVMKATRGKADPQVAREVLLARLSERQPA